MALPVIAKVTLQAAVISAFSNILAQGITASQNNENFEINWIPVFQFIVFSLLNTPPNLLWQSWLEETWPSSPPPKPSSEKEKQNITTSPAPLNIRNTAIKFILDQTIGAVVNTLLFSMTMGALQASMTPLPSEDISSPSPFDSLAFLFGGGAVDAERVDWLELWEESKGEFWEIVVTGWKLWPWVSLVNFSVVKSVEMRNLVGNLAGVGWGVYMSLLAAGKK